MIPVHEIAALGAASCWAITGLISRGPASKIGAIAFNRLRMWIVFGMLCLYSSLFSLWASVNLADLWVIILSGFVGIFIGDTALFLTLNRMGPRRTGILFAMNAPIAATLSWALLPDENLGMPAILGIALVVCGVVTAIIFGKQRNQLHHWEAIRGPLWLGVGLGLTAATAQAVGAMIIKPVMAASADPVAISAIRVGVAALGLTTLSALPFQLLKPVGSITRSVFGWTALSGFLGMGVGMTLVLFALSGGKVGIVTTFSSISPVIILPLIWLITGERPAALAWLGALLVTVGSALIFLY